MSSSTSTSNNVTPPTKPKKETSGDYYGKLIDLPLDGNPNSPDMKVFTVTLIAGLGLSMAGIEAIHQLRPFHNKELTIQLDQLSGTQNQAFETLFLGDSVTRQPFWGVPTSEKALMLATSAGVTTLGNEMIARRFFNQGNTAETVVLTFSPEGLSSDHDGQYGDTLFYPIFRKRSERSIIEDRTGRDGAANLPNGFIGSRVKSLLAFLKSDLGVVERTRRPIPAAMLDGETNYALDPRSVRMTERITELNPDQLFGANDLNLRNFENLVDYIHTQGAKVTFLIPPLIEGSDQAFLQSPFGLFVEQLSNEGKLNLLDTNDLRTYPASAFRDSDHLHTVWGHRFVQDVNTLFPSLGIESSGEAKAYTLPIQLGYEDLTFRSGKVVGKKGDKGIIASSVDVTVYAEVPISACIAVYTIADNNFANSVRLNINYNGNMDWHFPVGEKPQGWRWVERSAPLRLQAGWNQVSIGKREGAPINSVRLKACS